MTPKRRVLFLQLPLLDADPRAVSENLPLAALYLSHALTRSTEAAAYEPAFLPPGADDEGNAALLARIATLAPDVIACSLFLWNVERSCRLMTAVRRAWPTVRIVAGGPEVAAGHPTLFARHSPFDVLAVGEGEAVFPTILRHLRTGAAIDTASVATHTRDGWRWGARPAPRVRLTDALPPPERAAPWLARHPIAYLETTRGCPLHCTYCRYHHLYHRVSGLDLPAVLDRIRAFRDLGAREIRFVDPTLNAHPRFERLLEGIATLNADRRLTWFGEIKADLLTERQIDLLVAANFTAIEVGLQCISPAVQKAVRRPTRLPRLETALRRITAAGIHVTLDVMYGLPQQTERDVRDSIDWGRRFPNTTVQCMRTLLLPGTDLRAGAASAGLHAQCRPPYGVVATPHLPRAAMNRIERHLQNDPALPSDCSTDRFVGRRIPGLFREQYHVAVPEYGDMAAWPAPRSTRCTIVFEGDRLFERRDALAQAIRAAATAAPDTLWQFVLSPADEEPLDLLEFLCAAIHRLPPAITDRFTAVHLGQRIHHRLFVRLRPVRRYAPDWRRACEALLLTRFL